MVALRVTADDLDRERPRLLQEVANMFEGFPALAAMNNARELVRPTPTAAARRAAGAAPGDHHRGHQGPPGSRYYKPRNAILALAGDFDPAAARKAIESHFAGCRPASDPAPQSPASRSSGPSAERAGRPQMSGRRAHGLPGLPRTPAGQRALCPVPRAGVAALGRRVAARRLRGDRLAGLLHPAR